MKVGILGNNSAIPAHGRHPTAQLVSLEGTDILIDCGEGTQMQMQKFKWSTKNVDYILISHLHGDHFFGLFGLISTMCLLGRQKSLTIFAPSGLKAVMLQSLQLENGQYTFPIEWCELNRGIHVLVETNQYKIESFSTKHTQQSFGFIVTQKRPSKRLNIHACQQFNIPVDAYRSIVEGADFILNGRRIPNASLTLPGHPDIRYAYVGDTLYDESLCDILQKVDLMYHEATYLHSEVILASQRMHSTAYQAGMMAKKAAVKQLLIGHFSSRYKALDALLNEAASIFPNVQLSQEGEWYQC
jgi:ribonuclease Z